MTNEDRVKAIEVLEVHKTHWERLLDNGICDVLEGGNTIQALKVAISALKNEQTQVEKQVNDLEEMGKWFLEGVMEGFSEPSEQNVGMCQHNVGEMSEKTNGMTLDEAIKHEEEKAEEYQSKADKWTKEWDNGFVNYCNKCAEEHRQLAEWLKHYKKFRECMSMYYNGKIDKDKCFKMLTELFTENGRRKEEE